jgi:hypothetical protein
MILTGAEPAHQQCRLRQYRGVDYLLPATNGDNVYIRFRLIPEQSGQYLWR